MKIFGMEKLSLVDFDGYVSATLFTGACNFKCGFCHNASLVTDYKELPTYSEEEIFSYLKKRFGILEGVCITGGEPTLNPDLPELCKKIKDIGYRVKVDTNGTNPDMIECLIKDGLCDYFAMDIKNDKEAYGAIIGIDGYDTAKVERSVEILKKGAVPYEFRTTIILEHHKLENMEKIGKWLCGAQKYFLQKFRASENCLTQGLTEIPTPLAKQFIDVLLPYIPTAKLRGYDV